MWQDVKGDSRPYLWKPVDKDDKYGPMVFRHKDKDIDKNICLLIIDDQAITTGSSFMVNKLAVGAEDFLFDHINHVLDQGIWVCCTHFTQFYEPNKDLGFSAPKLKPGLWQFKIPDILQPYVEKNQLIALVDIFVGVNEDIQTWGPGQKIMAYMKKSEVDDGKASWKLPNNRIEYYSKNPSQYAIDNNFTFVAKTQTVPQDCLSLKDWLKKQLINILGWTEDKSSHQFINELFLAPYKIHGQKSAWPQKWGHDECAEPEMSEVFAKYFNIDLNHYSPSIAKSLLMLPNSNGGKVALEEWAHEHNGNNSYPLKITYLEKIFECLELNIIIEGKSELKINLPTTPSAPFLLSLKQFFNVLNNSSELEDDRGFSEAKLFAENKKCILHIKFNKTRVKGGAEESIPRRGLQKAFEAGSKKDLPGALYNLLRCHVEFKEGLCDLESQPWQMFFNRDRGLGFTKKDGPIQVEWLDWEIKLIWDKKG